LRSCVAALAAAAADYCCWLAIAAPAPGGSWWPGQDWVPVHITIYVIANKICHKTVVLQCI
jgi:hypothetical protein